MMGGGAGMILHAKQTMEANRDLIKSKSIYERRNALDLPKTRTIYQFKKATPELLEAIRAFKLLENRKIFKRQIVLGIICAGLFIVGLLSIFYF